MAPAVKRTPDENARLPLRLPQPAGGRRMSGLAIITGVGPGTGAAMARRFHAGGYTVAMLARNAGRLAELEAELPNAFAVACDVADAAALGAALTQIEQ